MQDGQVPDEMTDFEYCVKYHEMADEHSDQKRYGPSVSEGGIEELAVFTDFPVSWPALSDSHRSAGL